MNKSPLKPEQEIYNTSLKEYAENQKCPSCEEKVITKNPQEDDYLDYFDSIYCEKEDIYFTYMAFVNMKMEKKKNE